MIPLTRQDGFLFGDKKKKQLPYRDEDLEHSDAVSKMDDFRSAPMATLYSSPSISALGSPVEITFRTGWGIHLNSSVVSFYSGSDIASYRAIYSEFNSNATFALLASAPTFNYCRFKKLKATFYPGAVPLMTPAVYYKPCYFSLNYGDGGGVAPTESQNLENIMILDLFKSETREFSFDLDTIGTSSGLITPAGWVNMKWAYSNPNSMPGVIQLGLLPGPGSSTYVAVIGFIELLWYVELANMK